MTLSLPSGAVIDVTESTVLSKYITKDLQIRDIVKGCLIALASSTYSTDISLMCSPVCTSTVIGCTYDIPTGIYNMYVYDIEKEDILSDEWAISSTNITITALEPTYSYLYEVINFISSLVTIVTILVVIQ